MHISRGGEREATRQRKQTQYERRYRVHQRMAPFPSGNCWFCTCFHVKRRQFSPDGGNLWAWPPPHSCSQPSISLSRRFFSICSIIIISFFHCNSDIYIITATQVHSCRETSKCQRNTLVSHFPHNALRLILTWILICIIQSFFFSHWYWSLLATPFFTIFFLLCAFWKLTVLLEALKKHDSWE